jgi:hypothetical protein
MPSTKRQQLRRYWAQGKNNIERAAADVLRLKQIFEETHSEYAELADYVLVSLYMAIEGWDAFATHAWGKVPKQTIEWMT